MPEELASYHIPDGDPKHVASVNFLARLKEAEARLRAAQEKARQEAAAAAKAEEEARVAAEREAQAQTRAAEEADRHARHEATTAKVHQVEKDIARRIHPKRVAATVLAGLLFGAVLILTYELVRQEPAAAPVTSSTPAIPADQIEVVPSTAGGATPVAEPAIPDRGTPPGLE